jgi:hypothetical protein
MAAAIVCFALYAIWVLLQADEPNTGPITYLREFFTDWLSGMSGPLSVPFAAFAVFSQSTRPRVIWGCLALLAALFGSYRVWQRERLARHAKVAELQHQIEQLTQLVERLSARDGTERVWAELVRDDGKQQNVELSLSTRELRVNERAVPISRAVTGYQLTPMSSMTVEDGNYTLSFEFDGQQHKDRVQVRGGKMFAL